MNYQSTPRSNRPRVFAAKHVLQFALFAAFSLWLLYQIRQPNSDEVSSVSQVSNKQISNFFGRKGSPGVLKSTVVAQSGLTLEDETNPGEEGEIPRYSKGVDEVEFHIKKGTVKEGNNGNTLVSEQDGQKKTNEDGMSTMTKSNISFPDENGIPQHIRDRYIEIASGNKTRIGIQSVVSKHDRNGKNATIEGS